MTTAILIIAGIGLVSAVVLAVADRYLSVREDPRIGLVTAALPGANCGGCGFAGCGDYARALVAGTAAPGACTAADDACAANVARILGVAATAAAERRVALVRCGGSRAKAASAGVYNGLCDCGAAAATAGGGKGCAYGCLGYGSCARVCPKNAIRIEDGLARVEKRLCIGCGKCVAACPRQLIALVPASAPLHVLCSNPEKGPAVRRVCSVGCIGCRLCEKNAGGAAAHHFTFQGFLAQVDYANPPTDAQIAAKCPAKCILANTAAGDSRPPNGIDTINCQSNRC